MVQRFCISTSVGTIKKLVPPVFHPVWVNSQEKHKAIQIYSKKKKVLIIIFFTAEETKD